MEYLLKPDEGILYLCEACEDNPQLSHASNIRTKSNKANNKEKLALDEIVPIYAKYLKKQEGLKGYTNETIQQRVMLLNDYYDECNKLKLDKVFTSQSKFRSTILEEFMYFLFRDYVEEIRNKYKDSNELLQSGAAKAYTNLYFTAPGIEDFIKAPNVEINVKDQDFAIYRIVKLSIDDKQKELKVPVVAVENKTYLDKTMLEGVIATAEKLKSGNPYTRFVVVAENYDVDLKVDPKYSRIDQIYVLRKSKRKEPLSKIDEEVVLKFFTDTKEHIERPWSNIEEKMEKYGIIL